MRRISYALTVVAITFLMAIAVPRRRPSSVTPMVVYGSFVAYRSAPSCPCYQGLLILLPQLSLAAWLFSLDSSFVSHYTLVDVGSCSPTS